MLKRFVVLDMDRTLLDSAAYSELMMDACQLTPAEQAASRTELAAQEGKSYDFLRYLMALKKLPYETMCQRVLAAAQKESAEDVLMPGVRGLLQALDTAREHYGILTTGMEQNQALKLAVLRALLGKTDITLPAEITAVDNKSRDFVLNRWRERQKAFYISPGLSGLRGGMYAQRVILIDDKPANLAMQHAQLIALHVPVNPSAESHTLHSIAEYIRHTAE